MAPLFKRDDAGFALPESVIVLLIILGAGFLVCCGYAIHSAFGLGEPSEIKPISNEQMDYMAEVRTRNMDALAREGAARHRDYGSNRNSGR